VRLVGLFLALWAIALPAHAELKAINGLPLRRESYRRIVSLAPSTTELLYAAGWGDRVVGVSAASDFPPEARRKPQVGGAQSLNVERILALKPDLIVGIPMKSPVLAQLGSLSTAPVVLLPGDTLDSIASEAEQLSSVLGPSGRVFASRFRRELAAIAPGRRHPSVFYLVWDQPLMTAGPTTYLDDLIRRAGGRNVVSASGYISYSEERLIAAHPDVVLYPDNLEPGAKRLRARLPHARFIGLNADRVSRPGPRILDVIRQVARAFS
jgi:iron complex transport system substrate-binding protein